ncbi:hypothetical protein L3Q82_013798 [Scortum barcoo]|uniref:Uncharacterized protein n=1 Tax=Scortum barcoo TaxID=214431 RepID=A0ACB8VV68_9TELE|nr:hypothetical protein L3Q82_013798 [Scortum barcoo]
MEQVLDFAVRRELTKIVEASFDDLLLEITKMEREQRVLEERLDKIPDRGGGEKEERRRRGREEEEEEEQQGEGGGDPERPPVLAASQDWVPILDKVFGQKWCSNMQLGDGGGGGGGGGAGKGGAQQVEPLSARPLTLEPSPSSPQQDPRWTPLEDMEVFSPDEGATDDQKNAEGGSTAPAASPGPPLSPSGSSGRRSSASMLHRLLTLPSQLLEDDDEAATANETLAGSRHWTAPTTDRDGIEPSPELPNQPVASDDQRRDEEEEEEEEDEDEDKGRKKKRRRVWSECEECGRRFSRMSLLKAHRQTHVAENAAADTSSPSSLPGAALALRCLDCGKRFSSATRLHSHIRTQH